ncbi:GLUT4 regulating protein TUG [Metarhizium album ARSEF 1941]|uniref:GLUT4 regulating protein TUG n=1 Tax=Metarhizium album (strain ARSEF 1941) TaxID=1081103 RepID=A0A0B2WE57_METAS|nr:GLUT4 regulating protein TUG [Metarhizium album ARSEF 1941]KHN94146.1 GLUT4 regulating protein TUG [Metarhizium album ARSEF 1941]
MASHVVVIATDLRRATVNVTPGTYLSDVLDQACKKLGLSSDKYLLKHKQKQVDLSLPFRTSGLAAGAKLELVLRSNTPSAVQIALQIPQPEAKEIPGGRLIKKFPSDMTLWKVMRQFESGEASAGKNVNITARGYANTTSGSGQLYYETPVLNIMGREFSTFPEFQKTLFQLGHNSGNVLIRLGYKKTEQTLVEAMDMISSFFKDQDEDAKQGEAKAEAKTEAKEVHQPQQDQQDTSMADGVPEPAVPQEDPSQSNQPALSAAPVEQEAPRDNGASPSSTSQDSYQPVNVFLAPTGATPAAALVPASETDFIPTAAHAQLHQARLLESTRNKRLLSDKELEEKAAAQEARIASIKSILVRVRFPDNTSSEWQVSPSATGAFLYQAVRHVMADATQQFHLVLPGGKDIIKDDGGENHNLVKSYKLSGRVLVNLVWEDSVPAHVRKQPFLRANVARQGQAVKVPDLPAVDDAPEPGPTKEAAKLEDKKDKGDGTKIPKWFKLGKK